MLARKKEIKMATIHLFNDVLTCINIGFVIAIFFMASKACAISCQQIGLSL
jgi:hypothetical protein